MFASLTTIRGWRMSITSSIAIIEQQLKDGYSVILTGKLNQDALEVRRAWSNNMSAQTQ